jgi:photosystem II stability/assembly factor-like uncharacterized protein
MKRLIMTNNLIKRQVLFCIAMYIAACIASPLARGSEFQVVGPGGGGAMFHVTINPHDANEVLVSCDMTGSYITHDGGKSWRMFNLRSVTRFFAFDPVRPHVIYAGNNNLWRSVDDGASWSIVWPNPITIHGVRMNSDHADETLLSDPNPLGQIAAFAIDPQDSNSLVAGAVADGKAALFLSNDDGLNWKKEADLPESPRKIWIDPNSDRKSRDIYVAGSENITVRHHGTWQNRPGPAGVTFTDISAGFSLPHSVTIYVTSVAEVFISQDGAATWTASPLPGKGARIRAIATSRQNPETAYASFSHLDLNGKSWLGVARTQDSGTTWTLVWKEDKTTDASNVHDAWVTPEFDPEWGENPLWLAVADQAPRICYSTDLGRTMMTTDAGKNWYAVYSKKVPGGEWVSTGLDVTTSYGYLFDPFDKARQFIPMTDIGLFRSEDNGRSWVRSANGMPDAWSNTTYWITFDPNIRGKMWGVMSGTHDLPRPKMWRKKPVTAYVGGVCVSVDGGKTWKVSNSGMPETAPTHILLDPTSPSGKRTLWVAAMGRGVYKSTDDGVTWTAKNKGILQKDPLAWRLARAGDGTLYVVIVRRSEDGSIGTSGDGALYKSTDGAESWTPVNFPSGVNGPNGLTVDPNDPNRLYLAAWVRASGEKDGSGGGIYLSTDAGNTWKNVLAKDQHVYDVTVEPRDANVLYAAGFQSSAWRSNDRGEHWTRIPGFNFKWAQRVMPDLEDKNKIYISTFGGGIWHGPAQGDVGRNDIATPALQPEH